MILVDTNVWSEIVKAVPEPQVRAWERDHADRLWLSSVVIGEFLSGVELMAEGRRRNALRATYQVVIETYADRIATFDLSAALRYAEVLAHLERTGRNPGTADAQIAATALSRGMILATRNVKDFTGLGLDLIDPWLT